MAKWVKGQSGNPKGRPKSVFNAIKETDELLAQVDPKDKLKRTHGQVAVAAFVQKMKEGSARMWGEYLDRRLGKAPQSVSLDARVTTREERVANIIQNLEVLKAPTPDDRQLDSRPS